jgi:hypothetical protein
MRKWVLRLVQKKKRSRLEGDFAGKRDKRQKVSLRRGELQNQAVDRAAAEAADGRVSAAWTAAAASGLG